MAEHRWFYRTDDDWNAMVQQLKRIACPHCHRVGALIRHGFLRGFDDSNPSRRTLRARRIFCSNRNARPGCGRTFAVWLADKIRRLSLSTGRLWRFLHRTVADGLHTAIGDSDFPLRDRSWRRVWQRFLHAQSHIRTALLGRCSPPEQPAEYRPEAQVLAHLQDAFPDAPCPIAAFQHTLQTSFV